MYILSTKVLELLKSDRSLRFKVAGEMGNGEEAVKRDVKINAGKNIACHYDAINRLLDETGLTISDIRIQETDKK